MGTIPSVNGNVIQAPHVVILGAGASLAAFPNGDKNGKKLPLMNSLVEILNLGSILPLKYEPLFTDFEKLYSKIAKTSKDSKLKSQIDKSVFEYFYEMEVPEIPTLYDYLILSLREKDVIATFNWDPLLLQCMRRHSKVKKLPQVYFLHGNTSVGICKSCSIYGYLYNYYCHRCGEPYEQMQLLYPIENKDYSKNKVIAREWEALTYYLKKALYVSIFGYSAPSSDIDAKNLMLQAFLKNNSREFYELEVIDIKPENEVEDIWYNFSYKNHYRIHNSFKDSDLWYHPRRSCDAFFSAYLMNTPWSLNPFATFKTIEEMHDWIAPLVEDEYAVEEGQKGFKHKAKQY